MPNRTRRNRWFVTVLAMLVVAAGVAHAQDYPERPIRIIVPTAPGGAGDALARLLGERLGIVLRTPIVVENKPGASGVIGNDFMARAAPDGYTLLFATSATHVITAYTMAKVPYDPQRDFIPVINVAYATSVVVVSTALPVSTLGDLVDYARVRPYQLHYASSGVGSANHIDTEVFAALAGISLTHVPYRGTADGYRALLTNQVQVMFGAVTSALPHLKAGKLRALAVLTDTRSPVLPDVPTLAEAGLRNVDVRKWLGLLAPVGTPSKIVHHLNRVLNEILGEPQLRAWMDREGLEVVGGSSEEFERVLRADFVKWGTTVRKLGIRAE